MADEPEVEPPLTFDDLDTRVYGHLPRLVDGVTREAPTKETTLVALHQMQEGDDPLLRNLTGIAHPKVLAQVIDEFGVRHGPRHPRAGNRYRLKFTYNKLLLAPSLRLECIFLTRGEVIYHTVSIEFHFCAFSGPDTEIQSYQHSSDNIISFTARGASCAGFNKLHEPAVESRMREEEWTIIPLLYSFINPPTRHLVRLALHDTFLTTEEKFNLFEIRSRLPGGSGHLLPTIGKVEYACFGDDPGKIVSELGMMRGPRKMLSKAPRHPMVPLPASDTFRTLKEAAVELAHSSTILFSEESQACQLWASVTHRGTLFECGNFVAVGMKFCTFPRLGSKDHSIQYRLPKNLTAKLHFKIPGKEKREEFSSLLMSNVAGLPSDFDAYFVVVSKRSTYFQPEGSSDVPLDKVVAPSTEPFDVRIVPRISSFTHRSQLVTVSNLQESKDERWRGILLNQVHKVLEARDLTHSHGISQQAKAEADKWLQNFMAWNQEQLQVIQGIKAAKGGVVIVMGPAGTGKTLLQMALAIYFEKLGFHILALSPANSNANQLASALHKLDSTRFLRLYPSSRDHDVQNMAEDQRFHDDERRLPQPELMFTIDELTRGDGLFHKYGVVEAVINAAIQEKLILDRPLRSEGSNVGPNVNAWEILREFIERYKGNDLANDPDDPDKYKYTHEQYRLAYLTCKGHIIGLQRFIVTTTGNVLSREMLENFYAKEETYGIPRVGVMVFVDESAKDLEVNVWSAVVCKAWAPVRGVFLFGDDKQLQPTNTSSKGDVVFNPFSARLDISLPARLVREGFPCYRLVEQRRMHASIAAFPNQKIYSGLLRNGPGMDDPLEARKRGFWKVLSEIILQSSSLSLLEEQQYQHESADTKLRLHWIEVQGRREIHPVTSSSMVAKHIDVFFDIIYPKLRGYFDETGEKMGENVMIICAYSYALHVYRRRFDTLRKNDSSLKKEDMPQVLTVDASQGSESMFVIFDGSFQNSNAVGFMEDKGRANIAITRAREVFWIIGGSMAALPGRRSRKTTLMVEYKEELNRKRSHKFD